MVENSNVMIETPVSGCETMVENSISATEISSRALVENTARGSEPVAENSARSCDALDENSSVNRIGRPRKVLDLSKIYARLQSDEPLRSIARSLGVTHSTIKLHLQRAGLMEGFDW